MPDILKKFIKRLVTDVGTNNATARDQWIKSTLARLPAETRLLDADAGTQRYRSFCSHLHYVSQDFCEYKGKGDGIGMQTGSWDTTKIDIVSDIVAIPEKNGSFGVVLSTEVLEHIPDPIAALKEFRRLLCPVGELIITAPFCSITHMAPYHYFSGFNRYFYEHHLPVLGFTIKELVTNGNYADYTGQELRRLLSQYERMPFYVRACVGALLHFVGSCKSPVSRDSALVCYGYHVRAVKTILCD
jgi:SAM-dependent methyltransferase